MKRIKVLFINLIILTAASLLIRTIGIAFNVYLSNRIGAAGIGLYQLILSIYFLAITFSASGIRLAATRLTAEELAKGRDGGVHQAVRRCMVYGLALSGSVGTLLYFSASWIGTVLLGDVRTVLSLRLLAFSLTPIALSSALNGYFSAIRRADKTASVQLMEQVVKIGVTVFILRFFPDGDMQAACAAIVAGACAGEIASLLFLYLLYLPERRKVRRGEPAPQLMRRLLVIAVPVALSAYVTSGLRTVQHLLVPYGLKKGGASGETALSVYGMIHGMVMPVILFPSVVLDAIAELIVPELAECRAKGSHAHASYIVTRVFQMAMMTSIGVMCIFLRFSEELGMAIYHSSSAAYYIRILAPIIPVMYLDAIVDGMLKGSGQQISSMRYNIIESSICVALLYFLLPRYAIAGYIFTLLTTRTLNFWLSIRRLIRMVDLKIDVAGMVKALIAIGGALGAAELLFRLPLLPVPHFSVQIAMAAVFYYLLLRLTACLTREDLDWFGGIFR